MENKNAVTGEVVRVYNDVLPEQLAALEQVLTSETEPPGPTGEAADQPRPPGARPERKPAGARLIVVLALAVAGGGLACGLGHHESACAHQGGHKPVPVSAPARHTPAGRRRSKDEGGSTAVGTQSSEIEPGRGQASAPAGPTEVGGRRPECVVRAEQCVHRLPEGRCRTTEQPCRLLPLPIGDCELPIETGLPAEILEALRLQRDLLAGLIRRQKKWRALGPPVSVGETPAAKRELQTIGKLQYRTGFKDVWLGGEHYDLRGRAKARFCIQYLVAQRAFDAASARHLEKEIDPFVRKKCQLPPASEIRIQHYFNDRSGKLTRLRSDLVKAAGRIGRFYLNVK